MANLKTYSVVADTVTVVNAVVTLVFVNPTASGSNITFRRAWVSQAGTITLRQRVWLETQVTAFPTLVSATPARHNSFDPVSTIAGGTAGAAGTCGINASAEGAGTKTMIVADAFDAMVGWLKITTPEEHHLQQAGASNGLGLYFPAATGASPNTLNWIAGLTYSEQ
jgi:hypothetical protein